MGRAADAEVLVVGGGPAGLASALEARRRGLEVVVVDRRRPPIDKPCGEGLMPDGLARLAALGVRLPAGAGAPFRGIRYRDERSVAEGRFPAGHGLGLRRTVLHQALARRAEEAGVETRWGVAARGVARDGGAIAGIETDGGRLTARWIVAADGLGSRLRSWAGLERPASRRPAALARRRFGVRRHFARRPWSDLVEVWWGERCEAYVTPVGEREIGVAMLWSGGKASFDRLLARFPALGEKLAGAEPASRDRGAGPLARRPHAVVRGRLALVGDAAGYLDAITGEGLSLAFHQAAALGEALAGSDLAPYARACRRLSALPFALIRALLVAERRPSLRRRLIATLARDRELFERLLAIHARQKPLRELGWGGALRLVQGLVHP